MRPVSIAVCVLVACAHPAPPSRPPRGDSGWQVTGQDRPAAPATHGPVTLSIVGTNDLHGAIERLPVLAGFLTNLRAARAADGGGVVLVDGGDMFQGTLESNLAEGADVVRAYNHLHYAAAAIGNHEFDYGPEGPAATPSGPGDDPRGALKARAKQATFPFLASNIVDNQTGSRILWDNMPGSTLIAVAGVKVGIIGASTESTPRTTMAANFAGLRISPAAQAIAQQAGMLRAHGASVIIATMHIGSSCKNLEDPHDASSCDKDEELFQVLHDLPKGTVDVIVAGHTHAGMAHLIDGVAVIESFASGRAFGRVDLRIEPDGKVAEVHIDPPHMLCRNEKRGGDPIPVASCESGDYEGKPVMADPEVQKIADVAIARGDLLRNQPLGVTLTDTVRRSWALESAEGNLLTDLMLEAHPEAQVSLTNGGGLRADLPAGQLTYGQLFRAIPFDNRFALIAVTGKDLRAMVIYNLTHPGGILSWGGLTAKASCKAGKLEVQIQVRGKPVDDAAGYTLATSDFLASGGDDVIGRLKLPQSAIKVTDSIIRESLVDVLRGWKATPRAAIDPSRLHSPSRPRLDYPGQRPLDCAQAPSSAASGAASARQTAGKDAPK